MGGDEYATKVDDVCDCFIQGQLIRYTIEEISKIDADPDFLNSCDCKQIKYNHCQCTQHFKYQSYEDIETCLPEWI